MKEFTIGKNDAGQRLSRGPAWFLAVVNWLIMGTDGGGGVNFRCP